MDYTIKKLYDETFLINEQTQEKIKIKYLNKGMFSKVHLNLEDKKTVYIVTNDSVKEGLSQFCDNKHLPALERLGWIKDQVLYKSTLYLPLMASNKKNWNQLKLLKEAFDKVYYRQDLTGKLHHIYDNYNINCKIIKQFKGTASIKKALEELNEAMSNYGSTYLFEFSKRNVFIDQGNNLILLDVMFDAEELQKIRTNKRKYVIT